MAIKIEGTQVQKSGGGGLGKLLGKVLGGAAGFMVGGPAGILTGANIGGGVGGAIGGAVKPGQSNDLAVPVRGAQGPSTPMQPQGTSAIDRLNSALDIGSTIAGGAQSLGKLGMGAAKAPGLMLNQNSHGNAFQRRIGGIA